jgi:DNA-directed RNA polymerase subunit beta'
MVRISWWQEGQAVSPGDLLALGILLPPRLSPRLMASLNLATWSREKPFRKKWTRLPENPAGQSSSPKPPKSAPHLHQREDGKTAKLPKGSGMARYMLPVDAIILVEEGDPVKAGDIIAKLPRATTKTKDITGGLPRVAELFEVRKPKEVAVLSEIDGYVSISKATKKGKQRVTITPVMSVTRKNT